MASCCAGEKERGDEVVKHFVEMVAETERRKRKRRRSTSNLKMMMAALLIFFVFHAHHRASASSFFTGLIGRRRPAGLVSEDFCLPVGRFAFFFQLERSRHPYGGSYSFGRIGIAAIRGT